MKPTKSKPISAYFALSYALKNLIHPPLPLSVRDQQTLLKTLKSSFRSQLAASTVDPKSTKFQALPDLQQANTEPKFHSPAEDHFNDLFQGPLLGAQTHDRAARLQRFIQDPLRVFEEDVFHGKLNPQLGASALKQHTANMLASSAAHEDSQWATRAIIRVLKAYQLDHQHIHLNNAILRQQVVRTLVQGNQAEIAASMVTKDWLLKAKEEESGYSHKLRIRHALVGEVVLAVEEHRGRDAAAALLLKMVKIWKNKGGELVEEGKFHRLKQRTVMGQLEKNQVPTNPFQTVAYKFLRYYMDPPTANTSQLETAIRQQVYDTFFPWIRNKLLRARYQIHYNNDPWPLYQYILLSYWGSRDVGCDVIRHRNNKSYFLKWESACLEVLLVLIERGDWQKASNIIQHMHSKADMKFPGYISAEIVDEFEAMATARSPKLLKLVEKCSRQLAQAYIDLAKGPGLAEFWGEGLQQGKFGTGLLPDARLPETQ